MVRENVDRAAAQSHKPRIETQNQAPEESAAPEPAQNPDLDFLRWSKVSFREEPESWSQVRHFLRYALSAFTADPEEEALPTHLCPFKSADEYHLVKGTYLQLQHSSFYWGAMTMEEAHAALAPTAPGTFLIRDSIQPDVFFTLSYQSEDGPTSVRVQLSNLLFSLFGSQRTFASLFALLAFYTGASCKLRTPFRRQRPECLKQMCRRAFIRTYGAENISSSPGLSLQVKDYVHAYPYSI
ncbi:uncharacterized protein V6R79_001368 [Siganus canaliculatus]